MERLSDFMNVFLEEQKKIFNARDVLMEVKILTGKATNDEIYQFYKSKIDSIGLSSEEYEKNIKILCEIIGY